MSRNTKLVISIRTPDDADAALAGGADLLDIKEPTRGSLGRAELHSMEQIVARVAGRRPISLALGEWREGFRDFAALWRWQPLFVKFGLAGERQLPEPLPQLEQSRLVFAAYADHERAASPEPEILAEKIARVAGSLFLLDTWKKDGSTLFDWLKPEVVQALVERLHQTGTEVALAGSLGLTEMARARTFHPDWIAVRGAACAGGRHGNVEASRVRTLRQLLE